MGKLLLCTSDDALDKVLENIVDFTVSGRLKRDFGTIIGFHKLNITNENICVFGDDFIIGVGSYVYNNKIGKEALNKIYSDYSDDILEKLVGSFCIVIYKNKKLEVFVDRLSTYNMYYTINRDEIILTNTYFHVATGRIDIAIDDVVVIGKWLKAFIDNKTPLKGIFKLLGDEKLVYYDGKWIVKKYLKKEYYRIGDIVEIAQNKYRCFSNLFKTSGIFMTGGQDSRLSLALMLSLNMNPVLYYGIGDSSITFTKTNDRDIVKQISKFCKLKLHYMDWADTDNKNYEKYIKKYGELFLLYGCNQNVFNEFEKNILVEMVCFGYFGEVYRSIESIESFTGETFTLDEFIDDLYIGSRKRFLKHDFYSLLFLKEIKEQFLSICSNNNLDPNNLSKDDFQTLNTAYRIQYDTVMNNFANQYIYSIPLFGDYDLVKNAERIQYDGKCQSKFLMQCIEKMYPYLLQIPFFSHIVMKKFNSKTKKLVNSALIYDAKDRIREFLTNRYCYKIARYIYYLTKNDTKGMKEVSNSYKEKNVLLQKHIKIFLMYNLNIDMLEKFSDFRLLNDLVLINKMIAVLKRK